MTKEEQDDYRMSIIIAAMSQDYKTAYTEAMIYIKALEQTLKDKSHE